MTSAARSELERGLQSASACETAAGMEFQTLLPYGRRSGVKPALRSFCGVSIKSLALLLLLTAFGFFAVNNLRAESSELKLEATLVWGTNDKSSPDPNHKPVAADVEKKLKKLPFKWENYFEVNRQTFSVPKSGEKTVHMSKECDITVKNLGNDQVELHLIGKGKPVGKITQELPKGKILVTGGNADNFTAWFVVLRQVD